MRHVDFSPLYRSTVGFDRLFTMLDSLAQPDSGQTYPPYNIERTGEDAYRICMAVAGFSEEDISIEAHRNVLTVKGERKEENDKDGAELLYRGIAGARLRAPLPACRPRRGHRRRTEERPAAHRSEAQHSRGDEAAQDRDQQAAADKAKQIEATGRAVNLVGISSRLGSGACGRRFLLSSPHLKSCEPVDLCRRRGEARDEAAQRLVGDRFRLPMPCGIAQG